jgi:hypothetical protein
MNRLQAECKTDNSYVLKGIHLINIKEENRKQ